MKIIISILLFYSIPTFALTKFPKTVCVLEGQLLSEGSDAYFIVNPGTNSQTRFQLDKPLTEKKMQLVEVVLEITEETFSMQGKAKLKKINRLINPFKELKQYHLETNVKKACE